MNSDPNEATSRNHGDNGMSLATPPAMARSRKPDATQARSMTGWCFSPAAYPSWTAR
jgi:hypothetical protein